MEKSIETGKLAGALKAFQAEVESVKKDGTNPFFKSKYATLENVIATIKEPLAKHGLSFVQLPDGDGLYTIILHESGEWIGAHAGMELKGHTPKTKGSAITYMRRYALAAALGLATEEDDDGNAATQAAKTKPAVPKKVEAERDAKKKLIAGLLLKSASDPLAPMETKEQFEEQCRIATGLELVPENYDEILEILQK